MNKHKRQAILVSLLDALQQHGSWCGETHVQKSVYFLEEAAAVPLGLDFILYKHGPFSFDLREELGEMRANFLIDVESKRPYGPSLLPSQIGKEFASRFPKTTGVFACKVQLVAEMLAKQDLNSLERLGTALYVRRQFGDLPKQESAERILEIKPHIPFELALEAVHEVDRFLTNAEGIDSRADQP